MDKIYKLIDPDTREIRYIGKTAKKLSRRLTRHITTSKRKNSCHKDHWINKLLSEGRLPVIKLIHKVKDGNWTKWEIYYIKKYREKGHRLTNSVDGGLGGSGKMKQVTKDKISKALRGREVSADSITKQKATWGLRGRGKEASIRATKRIGELNPTSIPIIGEDITSGEIREFVNAREASNILRAEGRKASAAAICGCIRKTIRKGGSIRKSSGGYKWKTNIQK